MDGLIKRTDGRIDWMDGWIGWTDGQLNKRTHRWKVGRTDRRTRQTANKWTGWTRWTDGREGPDRLNLTDGQYGRTGWKNGGADSLEGQTRRKNGQTDWIDGLDKRLDWTDGRTKGRTDKLDWWTEGRTDGQTRRMDVSEVYFYICEVGHLHDGVVLLLRPESLSFSLSYLNFVMTLRFTVKLRKPWTPEKFQECWLCTGQSQ